MWTAASRAAAHGRYPSSDAHRLLRPSRADRDEPAAPAAASKRIRPASRRHRRRRARGPSPGGEEDYASLLQRSAPGTPDGEGAAPAPGPRSADPTFDAAARNGLRPFDGASGAE